LCINITYIPVAMSLSIAALFVVHSFSASTKTNLH
jgi:hypothetical protein